MGLTTIIGHLKKSETDLCYRSLSNLDNQEVSPFELARACDEFGWRCLLVRDRKLVYIAKTDDAMAEFKAGHAEGSFVEV